MLDFTVGRRPRWRTAKELGFLAGRRLPCGGLGHLAYSIDKAPMQRGRFQRLPRLPQGGLFRGASPRRRGGLAARSTGTSPTSRSATTLAAVRRERRGLPQGLPEGPALLHGGEQRSPAPTPRTRTSACRRRSTWSTWNGHDEAGVKLLHDAGSDWAFYNGGNRWTYGTYMYKAAKQFGMKFRLSWHWNAVAGDPYYALDCREDDYAWCNSSPDGELIPAVEFERLREGLDDYRRLLTLSRLAGGEVRYS